MWSVCFRNFPTYVNHDGCPLQTACDGAGAAPAANIKLPRVLFFFFFYRNSRLLFTVITTLQGQNLFQLLNEDYCLVQGHGILIEYLNHVIYCSRLNINRVIGLIFSTWEANYCSQINYFLLCWLQARAGTHARTDASSSATLGSPSLPASLPRFHWTLGGSHVCGDGCDGVSYLNG